jgi:hypothetical protein
VCADVTVQSELVRNVITGRERSSATVCADVTVQSGLI